VFAAGIRHQLTIRVVLREFAATIPKIAMTTTAPTTIHSHGTVLVVVVVVVVPSVVVDLSVVELEPAPGAVTGFELPAAGPVVVVVVELVFDVPELCASVIAGAMARKRARRMRLSRKIGRIGFSSMESAFPLPCPGKPNPKTPSRDDTGDPSTSSG
jgi:hypothetical protein